LFIFKYLIVNIAPSDVGYKMPIVLLKLEYIRGSLHFVNAVFNPVVLSI